MVFFFFKKKSSRIHSVIILFHLRSLHICFLNFHRGPNRMYAYCLHGYTDSLFTCTLLYRHTNIIRSETWLHVIWPLKFDETLKNLGTQITVNKINYTQFSHMWGFDIISIFSLADPLSSNLLPQMQVQLCWSFNKRNEFLLLIKLAMVVCHSVFCFSYSLLPTHSRVLSFSFPVLSLPFPVLSFLSPLPAKSIPFSFPRTTYV